MKMKKYVHKTVIANSHWLFARTSMTGHAHVVTTPHAQHYSNALPTLPITDMYLYDAMLRNEILQVMLTTKLRKLSSQQLSTCVQMCTVSICTTVSAQPCQP